LSQSLIESPSTGDPAHGLRYAQRPGKLNSASPKYGDPIHVRALWFPRFITIVFIFFWVGISIASWKYPWL
jgi:hypothetical protein